MFGVSIFSNLKLHAKALNQKADQSLIVNLKFLTLCGDLFDKDLELDTRAVLRVNELADGVIEFLRIFIKIDIEVSKLVEDKFFPLPVL